MRFFQGIHHLQTNLHDLGCLQGSTSDLGGQSLSLHILHGDKVDPIRFSNFVYRGNIRVLERRSRLRLSNKASHSVWIGSELGRHQA